MKIIWIKRELTPLYLEINELYNKVPAAKTIDEIYSDDCGVVIYVIKSIAFSLNSTEVIIGAGAFLPIVILIGVLDSDNHEVE